MAPRILLLCTGGVTGAGAQLALGAESAPLLSSQCVVEGTEGLDAKVSDSWLRGGPSQH